jgi:predicted HicB family RNase H-like nuclease
MKNKFKSIKITEELHKELKIYSVQHSLKLNSWIEELLKEKLNELKCQKD